MYYKPGLKHYYYFRVCSNKYYYLLKKKELPPLIINGKIFLSQSFFFSYLFRF